MPKLAIYVPKRDMRIIERWRKQVNFSQVFMHALLEEIQKRSRKVGAGADRVEAAADYYKRQLLENDTSLVDFGFELGSEHVIGCRLTPTQIRALAKIPKSGLTDEGNSKTINECIGQDAERLDGFAAEHGIDEQFHPNWRTAVHDGYLQGVAAAWKQVCERITK